MAGHDEAGRVEGLRRALQQLRCGKRRDEIERGRGQRILRAGEQFAGQLLSPHIERPDIGDTDIGQAGDALARPARVGWGQHLEDRLQIVEDRQDEPAAAPEEPLQRAALGRLEQFGEMAVAGEKGRKRHAEDGIARIGLTADRPWGPPLDRDPAAMPAEPGVGRHIEPGLGTGAVAQPADRIKEADGLKENHPLLGCFPVDLRPDRHMVGIGLENDRSSQRVGSRAATAAPSAHSPSWSPCPRPMPRRAAACRDRAQAAPPLASGRVKPPATKSREARSNSRSTTASAPPRDSFTMARSWVPGIVVAPLHVQSSPSFAASASRSSRMSHSGVLAAVAVERRRPPQPARMLRVLPEIEDPRAAPSDDRDVVGPVEDRSERVAVGGKARVAKARQGRRVLRLDPGERPLAVDLFEPEIRVVVGCLERRPRVGATMENCPSPACALVSSSRQTSSKGGKSSCATLHSTSEATRSYSCRRTLPMPATFDHGISGAGLSARPSNDGWPLR